MAKHSGLQYEDVLIGASSGETPGDGKIVGFEARVMIGDQVTKQKGALVKVPHLGEEMFICVCFCFSFYLPYNFDRNRSVATNRVATVFFFTPNVF